MKLGCSQVNDAPSFPLNQSFDSQPRFATISKPWIDRSRQRSRLSWSQPTENENRLSCSQQTEKAFSSASAPFCRCRPGDPISPPQWLIKRHKQNGRSSQRSSQEELGSPDLESSVESLKALVDEARSLGFSKNRELELLQKTIRQTSDKLQAKHAVISRSMSANQHALHNLIEEAKKRREQNDKENSSKDEKQKPAISVQERQAALQELCGGLLQQLGSLEGGLKQMNCAALGDETTKALKRIESEIEEDNAPSSVFGLL